MRRELIGLILGVSALASSAGAISDGSPPRAATEILREYDRLHFPSMSRGGSEEAVREFEAEIRSVARAKVDLAAELWEADADHPRADELLESRWALMTNSLDRGADVLTEAEPFLESERKSLRRHAVLARARAGLMVEELPYATKRKLVEHALDAAPRDSIAAVHLAELATDHTSDDDEKRALCRRLVDGWPDEPYSGRPARGLLRQLDRIGAPLDPVLTFDDARTGEPTDVEALSATAIVVMVWSGSPKWIADEIRALVELRDEAPKRTAIVGVYNSRRDGGAPPLIEELERTGFDGPLWYDEAMFHTPWDGPFKTSRTPLFLVLDGDGTVRSAGYRVTTVAPRVRELVRPRARDV